MLIRSSLFALLSLLTLPAPAQDSPTPLERTLSGVVTVGVFNASDTKRVLGFGNRGDNTIDVAYEKPLNMAGAHASGSGFVFEQNGQLFILTNAHVIDAASDRPEAIAVYSITRTRYSVRIVGGDSFYDLAVLAFDSQPPGNEFEPLTFSDAEARLTQKVYAIGNPLGNYPYTITEGIISGKNRLYQRPTTGRFGFLQHTATLLWGNSGGPLVDEQGRVVGVNTWIGTEQRDGQNYLFSQLNFALEGRLAHQVALEIINDGGRVRRAFFGVEFAVSTGIMQPDSPPFINGILPNSPAAAALSDRIGYTVTAINEQPIATLQDIVRILETVKPEQSITLRLKKGINAPTVTLPAQDLSVARLEEVAVHFFQTFADYQVQGNDSGVALTPNPEKKTPRIERLTPTAEGPISESVEGQNHYTLLGAGQLDNYGRATLYRVNNLHDLGAIIRLCSLEGHLGASLLAGEDKVENVRFFLTNKDLDEIKVLYY